MSIRAFVFYEKYSATDSELEHHQSPSTWPHRPRPAAKSQSYLLGYLLAASGLSVVQRFYAELVFRSNDCNYTQAAEPTRRKQPGLSRK